MTSITLVRRFGARPSIVFEALSTADGIAQWWGPDAGPVLISEVDLRVGGAFRVRFRSMDGLEHECFGHFLEVRPPERLVMTWRWVGGAEDPGESQLSLALRPIDGDTELTLIHSRLANEATGTTHRAGWEGALDKLQAHSLLRCRSTTVPP